MSTNQGTVNDGWETLKNLLERTEAEIRRELKGAPPVVEYYLRAPIEAATRSFDGTMKSISNSTDKEQLELLKTYRKFLSGQMVLVESRLKELDQRVQSHQTELTQEEIWRAAQRTFAFPSGPNI
ncbi:MAG TPA: hypothetical protein VKF39_06145 [Nitrososphaerales archaeon]|nr:hypothetical protein [Nitrososphaerales archaeon]